MKSLNKHIVREVTWHKMRKLLRKIILKYIEGILAD
jgi:hypothetical protein